MISHRIVSSMEIFRDLRVGGSKKQVISKVVVPPLRLAVAYGNGVGGRDNAGIPPRPPCSKVNEQSTSTPTAGNMAAQGGVDAPLQTEIKEIAAVPPSSSPSNTNAGPKPPPESAQSLWLRRSVILSFWAVVLLLGLPVWWKTTAIYRSELPIQSMTDWAEGKVRISSFSGHVKPALTPITRSPNLYFLSESPSKHRS